jgi:hypothetical protein
VAIELALRLEKLILIGFKDGLEFDFIAIFFGRPRGVGLGARGSR